jgi:hypothetical protein
LRSGNHDSDGNKIIDNEHAASDRAAAAQKASAQKQSFTSKKLDWVNYLMRDHRLYPVARLVGIALAQTINEKTEISIASDRYIADVLGICVRTVIASRMALRDHEWLAWYKPNPRAPNQTKLVLIPKNIESIRDEQTALKDQRDFEASERMRR